MQYGLYEIILNTKNLIITKVFHRRARLIRYPFYLRNGKNVHFDKEFTCGYNCRIESVKTENGFGKIVFGKNVKMGDFVHIASAKSVEIGDNVLIASHVFISDLDHGRYSGDCQDSSDTIPDKRKIIADSIKIGDKTWIGENVVILKGVHIGSGCIIGANALVNKNIPDNSIAVGQPSRIIKMYNESTNRWEKYND